MSEDIVERLEEQATYGYMPVKTRQALQDARAEIVALREQLADEAFKYAQAVYPMLLGVETEDALKVAGIYTYGPDAEKFEAMFAAAMRTRKTLIEADAIAAGQHKGEQS